MRHFLFLFCTMLGAASLETVATPSFFFYEENVGQADASARLLVRGSGNRTYLSSDSIYLFSDRNSEPVRVRFAGPDATPSLRSLEPWPGVVTRFEGPSQNWRRAIPAHRRVQFSAIAPNVDLILREADGYPGFTYVLHPGADLSQISLEVEGLVVRGAVDVNGRWVLSGGFFGAIFGTPRAYQNPANASVPMPAEFIAASEQQVRFRVPSYDRTLPLYIEVDIFDGSPRSELSDSASGVDAAGNVYLAGSFVSAMRCSTAPGGTIGFCPDAFVAGLDSQGRPMFLTVLAGQQEDFATHLAIDPASGEIVITGNTGSANFPVTPNAYQSTNAGPLGPRPRLSIAYIGDIFVSRIHPRNGDLQYSTFIGSPDGDAPTGLTLASGSVSILAESGSRFPTTSNAWMSAPTCQSCFSSVALRLNSTGSGLLFATCLRLFVPWRAIQTAPSTRGRIRRELGRLSLCMGPAEV